MATGKPAPGNETFAGLILKGVKETGEEFGVGAYGRVFAVDYYGTVCAAKEIHANLIGSTELTKPVYYFLRECQQCAELRHPNVVQFLGVYYKPGSPLPILVMEKMGESLRYSLERYPNIPMTIKLSILFDVSLGLRYLHSNKIVHRDLSSNNILLTSLLRAKISDLGVAKVVKTDSKKSLTHIPGTADFMPPEAQADIPIYDTSLDVFSYGGVMLHTASQKWPTPSAVKQYDPKTRKVRGFTEVERRQSYIDKMTGNAKELVPLAVQCLDDDPDVRPTMIDVSEGVKKLKDRSPDVNMNLMSILQQKNQLESEINQQKRENDQQKREIDQQKREIDQQKWENDQQKREIDQQKWENDQQKREIDQQKTEIDQQKREIDCLQKHIHDRLLTKQKQSVKTAAQKESPVFPQSLQSKRYKLQWTSGTKLPTAMHGAYATVINSTLYITGGWCPNDKRNSFNVYKYESDKDQWSALPPLQYFYGVPVIVNNHLTIIGGRDSHSKAINWVVTFSDYRWKSIYPNLSVARLHPAVVPYHQYVIVAGGKGDDGNVLDSIEVFNITTSHWIIINTHLPQPMYQISASVFTNSFIIVGYAGADGKFYNGTFMIAVDDIISKHQQIKKSLKRSADYDNIQWNQLAPAPYWRTALVPNTSSPVIIGGNNKQDNAVDDIAIYDDSSNEWKKISTIPINCACTTVAVINQSIIVMGGCSGTKTYETRNATALSDVNIGLVCD